MFVGAWNLGSRFLVCFGSGMSSVEFFRCGI